MVMSAQKQLTQAFQPMTTGKNQIHNTDIWTVCMCAKKTDFQFLVNFRTCRTRLTFETVSIKGSLWGNYITQHKDVWYWITFTFEHSHSLFSLFIAFFVESLQPSVRYFYVISNTIRPHCCCLSPLKSPPCTTTGFRPFTVNLILDYLFFPSLFCTLLPDYI